MPKYLITCQTNEGVKSVGERGGGGLFDIPREIQWPIMHGVYKIVDAYAHWEGIRIAKEMVIHKLTILGDSMLVIRAMIKINNVGNNVFTRIMSRFLDILVEFEEYTLYHIKHEHNFCVDRWDK
jgi:hypothetical protein